MLSVQDAIVLLYVLHMTLHALKAPTKTKKDEFVRLSQIWLVVGSGILFDSLTWGMVPFADSIRLSLVAFVCFRQTRDAAATASIYLLERFYAHLFPVLFQIAERLSLYAMYTAFLETPFYRAFSYLEAMPR